MQDSVFENVDANNLYWTQNQAIVATSNITYSNVTTARTVWDAAGEVVGAGDEANTVLDYEDGAVAPSPLSALDNLVGDSIPLLAMDDPWIVSVQQVGPPVAAAAILWHELLHWAP